MASFTPNYDLEKPVVGGDLDVWGGKLNTNFDKVDTAIKARADATATVATNLATLDAAVVKKDGTVSMTGPLVLPAGNPTLNTHATNKSYVDNGLSLKAPLASPALTGTPTSPTAASGTNTTQIATTAFVTSAVATGVSTYAPLASPALTGTPTSPTASAGTNTTQIATTAFVQSSIWKPILKTSDQSRLNSTVFVADSQLSFSMNANKKYLFRAYVVVSCVATYGIKLGLAASQTPQKITASQASTDIQTAAAAGTQIYTVATAQSYLTVPITGYVFSNASIGGTFSIMLAQVAANASTANAAIIREGSFIEYIEVA